MRVAVIGSGGVGGYFGAQLAAGGTDIAFIARGRHLEAMHQKGLRVISGGRSFLIGPERCFGSPADIGPVDVVLFCVKSYDTESAGRELDPLLQPETVIISLQNGVDNEEKLRRVIPRGIVFGGVAYVYATITQPGEITESGGPKKIAFGPFEDAPEEHWQRARAILDVCLRAGVQAEVPGDILAALWKKFIFITGAAGITAVSRLTLGEILAVEETRTLLSEAMKETESVARAMHVRIDAGYLDGVLDTLGRFDPTTRSSLYYDLIHRKPMEVDALSGTVVRYGALLGVPTPIQKMIYAVLLPYHLQHSRTVQ